MIPNSACGFGQQLNQESSQLPCGFGQVNGGSSLPSRGFGQVNQGSLPTPNGWSPLQSQQGPSTPNFLFGSAQPQPRPVLIGLQSDPTHQIGAGNFANNAPLSILRRTPTADPGRRESSPLYVSATMANKSVHWSPQLTKNHSPAHGEQLGLNGTIPPYSSQADSAGSSFSWMRDGGAPGTRASEVMASDAWMSGPPLQSLTDSAMDELVLAGGLPVADMSLTNDRREVVQPNLITLSNNLSHHPSTSSARNEHVPSGSHPHSRSIRRLDEGFSEEGRGDGTKGDGGTVGALANVVWNYLFGQ